MVSSSSPSANVKSWKDDENADTVSELSEQQIL